MANYPFGVLNTNPNDLPYKIDPDTLAVTALMSNPVNFDTPQFLGAFDGNFGYFMAQSGSDMTFCQFDPSANTWTVLYTATGFSNYCQNCVWDGVRVWFGVNYALCYYQSGTVTVTSAGYTPKGVQYLLWNQADNVYVVGFDPMASPVTVGKLTISTLAFTANYPIQGDIPIYVGSCAWIDPIVIFANVTYWKLTDTGSFLLSVEVPVTSGYWQGSQGAWPIGAGRAANVQGQIFDLAASAVTDAVGGSFIDQSPFTIDTSDPFSWYQANGTTPLTGTVDLSSGFGGQTLGPFTYQLKSSAARRGVVLSVVQSDLQAISSLAFVSFDGIYYAKAVLMGDYNPNQIKPFYIKIVLPDVVPQGPSLFSLKASS